MFGGCCQTVGFKGRPLRVPIFAIGFCGRENRIKGAGPRCRCINARLFALSFGFLKRRRQICGSRPLDSALIGQT
jgi:hypothetical protein